MGILTKGAKKKKPKKNKKKTKKTNQQKKNDAFKIGSDHKSSDKVKLKDILPFYTQCWFDKTNSMSVCLIAVKFTVLTPDPLCN